MSSLREDFYLVFAGTLEDGKRAAMKVFINPLQVWLWYGALVTMLGTIIVILPRSSAQKGVQLASAQELA
mgnify:FL=1